MKMNNKKVRLYRDQASGEFLLLYPGLPKVKVGNNLETAWLNLEEEFKENIDYFETYGLSDEAAAGGAAEDYRSLNISNILIKGTVFAIPTFICFLLFALVLTNQFRKLSAQVGQLLRPDDERSSRSITGFKKNIEHYRPYIREAMLLFHEENQKTYKEITHKKD